jgi:hypothetical protein
MMIDKQLKVRNCFGRAVQNARKQSAKTLELARDDEPGALPPFCRQVVIPVARKV